MRTTGNRNNCPWVSVSPFIHALCSREWSLSVQVSISATDCVRFRSTTVYRTSKFVRHGENGEQWRVHCCRPIATQSLAYEKLSRIGYFDLIFCENGTEEIIRFLLIIFEILRFTSRSVAIRIYLSLLFIFLYYDGQNALEVLIWCQLARILNVRFHFNQFDRSRYSLHAGGLSDNSYRGRFFGQIP